MVGTLAEDAAGTRAVSLFTRSAHGVAMHPSEATDGLLGLCPDGLRIESDPADVDLAGEWPVVIETADRFYLAGGPDAIIDTYCTHPARPLRRINGPLPLALPATQQPVAESEWFWAALPPLEDAWGAATPYRGGVVRRVRTVKPVGGTQVVEGVRFHAFPRKVVGDVWVRPTCRFGVHLEDGAIWLLDLPAERFYCWPGDGGQPQAFEGVGASHLERGVPLRLTVVPAEGAMVDLAVGVVRSIVAEVPVPC